MLGLSFAQEPFQERLAKGLNDICVSMVNVLPILFIVLLVMAAVVYGVGHVFGAEMRSKATSWATTMVVGAVISLLIFVLARPLLGLFLPQGSLPQDFCMPAA